MDIYNWTLKSSGSVAEPKNESILVVDDDPDISNLLRHILVLKGYAVDAYSDPELALSSFAAGKYSLVILDFKMSPINGFDLYDRFVKMDGGTKVLFLSADSAHYAEHKASHPATNARKYLHKPVRMNDFLKQVGELLLS